MSEQYNTRQTLIQRLKKGQSEQSWADFLRIYHPYIRAIIRNMGITGSDADDLVQQVLIRLWKHIDSYLPEKRFRTWLSCITGNCVRDHIRKSIRDSERMKDVSKSDHLAYLIPIRQADIEEIAEREWEIHLTNMALDRIRDKFSGRAIQVFMMSLKGADVREISRQMELKENSVYRLKNRVKHRLIEEIKLLREELR